MNCVEEMQNDCAKTNVPFEVLIQGPSGNRFVRSLLTEDSIARQPNDPQQRSTVSIFKPDENKNISDTKEEVSASKPEATTDMAREADTIQTDETPKEVDEPKAEEVKVEAAKETETIQSKEIAKDDENRSEDTVDIKTKVIESPEQQNDGEQVENSSDEGSTEKPSESDKTAVEKKLIKRDAESELEEAIDEANKQDAIKSGSDADTESATEQSLGIFPKLGLKLLPLKLGGLKTKSLLHKSKLNIFFCFVLCFWC